MIFTLAPPPRATSAPSARLVSSASGMGQVEGAAAVLAADAAFAHVVAERTAVVPRVWTLAAGPAWVRMRAPSSASR